MTPARPGRAARPWPLDTAREAGRAGRRAAATAASRSPTPSPARSTWSPRPTERARTLIRERLLGARPGRRVPRRGGRRRRRDLGRPLDRRPDRRHRELPLRPAALRRLDRRGRGTTRWSPGWCSAPPRAGVRRHARWWSHLQRRTPPGPPGRPPSTRRWSRTGFGYETDVRARQAQAVARMLPAGARHPAPGVLRPRPVRGRRRPAGRLRRGRARTSGTTPPAGWSPARPVPRWRSGPPSSAARPRGVRARRPVGPILPGSYGPAASSTRAST